MTDTAQEKKPSISDLKLFKFMIRYARQFKVSILISLLLLIFSTVFKLVQPAIIGRVIDLFINGNSTILLNGMIKYGLLYLLVLAVMSFTIFLQVLLIGRAGQNILYAIRDDIFKHVIKLDLQFFNKTPVGKVVTRITNDTETLNDMYTSVLLNVITDVFIIAGVIIGSFIVSPKIALVIIILLPVVIMTSLLFRKVMRMNYRSFRNHLSGLNAFLSESISSMKIISLLNIQQKKKKEFEVINQNVHHSYMIEVIIYGIFRPLLYFSTQIIFCAVLYFAARMVIDKEISVGTVFIFIQYMSILFEPLYELAEQFNVFQSAISATEKIEETLSVKQSIISIPDPVIVDRSVVRGHIEFRHVWFAYTNEDWVLKDVSFTIAPGESIAIVGPTGAGKSSIINLISRYYDIQKGEIILDGVNIKDIEINSLRRCLGVVMQDVFIFAGTFKENIRLFDDSITDDKIKKSSEFVNADKFINAYKDSYNHYIEERGATLSSGQRQLISFARVMAFDNPILILDEATASIDTETEGLIQAAVNNIMSGRTTIAIAHRLSTIVHVNRIMVLSKGEIKETGTHHELLAMKGLYFQLYTHQFL